MQCGTSRAARMVRRFRFFLQTLPEVARRLGSAELLRNYTCPNAQRQHARYGEFGASLCRQNSPAIRSIAECVFHRYPDYKRQLWQFIEESDDEDFFEETQRDESAQEDYALPPRHYPEWDYASQAYRLD